MDVTGVLGKRLSEDDLRPTLEVAIANRAVPQQAPPMSVYDLRILLASLDDVEPQPSWKPDALWIEIHDRP